MRSLNLGGAGAGVGARTAGIEGLTFMLGGDGMPGLLGGDGGGGRAPGVQEQLGRNAVSSCRHVLKAYTVDKIAPLRPVMFELEIVGGAK